MESFGSTSDLANPVVANLRSFVNPGMIVEGVVSSDPYNEYPLPNIYNMRRRLAKKMANEAELEEVRLRKEWMMEIEHQCEGLLEQEAELRAEEMALDAELEEVLRRQEKLADNMTDLYLDEKQLQYLEEAMERKRRLASPEMESKITEGKRLLEAQAYKLKLETTEVSLLRKHLLESQRRLSQQMESIQGEMENLEKQKEEVNLGLSPFARHLKE